MDRDTSLESRLSIVFKSSDELRIAAQVIRYINKDIETKKSRASQKKENDKKDKKKDKIVGPKQSSIVRYVVDSLDRYDSREVEEVIAQLLSHGAINSPDGFRKRGGNNHYLTNSAYRNFH